MSEHVCSNPECSVATTGKCIEGFAALIECPHYGSPTDKAAPSPESTPNNKPQISLSKSGKTVGYEAPLTMQEATSVLTHYDTRVIACLGPQSVGKTTLFASIYERLHQQPIGNYQFGGSLTLYPFERLCFSARMEAGGSAPSIPRTQRQDAAHFYHLAFKDKKKGHRIDLLLADRAGEEYADAMDHAENCLSLFEVRRANTVLILVDGSRLADQALRHDARRQAVTLVRAIHAAGLLVHTKHLGVVLTKYDRATLAKAMVDDEITKIADKIKEIVSQDGVKVSTIITAAMPEEAGDIEAGYGIEDLINYLTLPAFPGRFEITGQNPVRGNRSFHRLWCNP